MLSSLILTTFWAIEGKASISGIEFSILDSSVLWVIMTMGTGASPVLVPLCRMD